MRNFPPQAQRPNAKRKKGEWGIVSVKTTTLSEAQSIQKCISKWLKDALVKERLKYL